MPLNRWKIAFDCASKYDGLIVFAHNTNYISLIRSYLCELAQGSPAPTTSTKHFDRGGAVQLSTGSAFKKKKKRKEKITPNGSVAAAAAV